MNPNRFEILDWSRSPRGVLCLRRRELLCAPGRSVTEVTLGGELLMSSWNTLSERELARLALQRVEGSGLRARVGGLGLGYTTAELLDSERVDRVETVEVSDRVIDWFERRLVPLADRLAGDERSRVRRADIFAELDGPPERPVDLLLLDVDHSPEELLHPSHEGFYSPAGLGRARGHVAPGGVLGLWSGEPAPRFRRALEEVFDGVEERSVRWENDLVGEARTDWIYLASRGRSSSQGDHQR